MGTREKGERRRGRAKKWLLRTAIGLVAVIVILAVYLRLKFGGGEPYPDLSSAPLFPEDALEVVVTVDEPIGNVAVSATGRVFFTIHPESRPSGPKLLEWVNGKAVAYPSAEAQDELFATPLGVVVDAQERLWTIDHGMHASGKPRLLAFDLKTGKVAHDHAFDGDVAPLGSFFQDLKIDPAGETVFIADVAFFRKTPALIIYDVKSGSARRVLDSHPSVMPQDFIIRNPTKEMVFFGGVVALKAGVDGIAISKDGEWIFYAAMNHDTLYRVRAADLKDASLSPADLASRVQAVGKKPLNDGLTTDVEGNVLITDVEHGAVMRMRPSGALETLVKTPRIRWADAVTYGPEGWLYVADSAIPDQMLRSKGHIASRAPYFIYRFKPGIDGVIGR